MSEERAPYAVQRSTVIFDWDRIYSPVLNTIQWKATYKGHRYIVWLDPGEVDPDGSFLAATEPSGEDLNQHAYPTPAAARAACVRHYQTGEWE